ncbi:hypothetical protein MRB53_041437 [Persea americana]|nr:hypothetical protein MRB53_041437 [Persea americana]
MQLLYLCRFNSRKQIIDFLDSPIRVLGDLYTKIMASLDDADRTPAERNAVTATINWLLHGVLPLPVEELMLGAETYADQGFAEGECNQYLIRALLPGLLLHRVHPGRLRLALRTFVRSQFSRDPFSLFRCSSSFLHCYHVP